MTDYKDWLSENGWKENPFTLKIDPSLFVGYSHQQEDLMRHVNEGQKLGLITGSTGSGKTTMMLLLKNKFSRECEIIYLGKPPRMDELVEVFTDRFRPSFFEKILGVNVHVHNLHEYVNRKCKKKLILMVDELHEADVEALEWLRTLNDHIPDMQIIMSGLPTSDEFLRKNLETLRNRITTWIELTSLSEQETREFIKKRIESVGGSGLGPFNESIVSEIYRRSGGFPREILKMSNGYIENLVRGEEPTFRESETKKIEMTIEQLPEKNTVTDEPESETSLLISRDLNLGKDFVRDLPSKQRRILKILLNNEDMYPSEIASDIGIEKYKTKQHAVRSMNNILQRLMNDGYVQRRSRGKGFVYYLEPKVRSVLTEA